MSGDAFKLGQFCQFNLRLVKSYLFVNGLNANISTIIETEQNTQEVRKDNEEQLEQEKESKENDSPVNDEGVKYYQN